MAALAGCDRSAPQQDAGPFQRPTIRANTVGECIASWTDMGMWLPDSQQIEIVRAQFKSARGPLRDALSHSDDSVRMRAAYVIGQIGPQARPAGEDLLAQFVREPDRTVRMYIVNALNLIDYNDAATVDALANRYGALDGRNVAPSVDHSYPEVDEKITIASALFTMAETRSKSEYYEFVVKWLDPPNDATHGDLLEGYWERRWMAVNVLERMPGATDAIPKLQSLQAEANAKPWVNVHVPRVLAALRSNAR
ncbi:MAG: HEAT repeat domain-containing protein [Thermoguttaceae bacterium]|nr:HEAT repeat domain-containing protein [Thermoguttaceae bacterium]